MPSERFTKEKADNARLAAEEIWEALPKTKQIDFLGELNEVFLFIEAAKVEAPEAVTSVEE